MIPRLIFFSAILAFMDINSYAQTSVSNDCPRGKATPLVKTSVYPKTTFKLHEDSLSATETVLFPDGDKLIIRNTGCEYYVLSFRFETTRFVADTTDIAFWYKKALLLANDIQKATKDPFGKKITAGLSKLVNYIMYQETQGNINIRFGEELDFGDPVIRDYITVDRVEKLNAKTFAVELSFVTGPL